MLHPRIKAVSEIMLKYAYPNIKKKDIRGFCLDVCMLLGSKHEMKPDEKFVFGVLKRAAGYDKLRFIQDNEDYLLQEDYASFYIDRILMFPKSKHCFDVELSIQNKVERFLRGFGNENLSCYCFENSTNNCMVQISDLVAGLLGKMFTFFNKTYKGDFRKIIEELSDLQIENLCELQRLRVKSDAKNKGFLQNITAIGLMDKENDFWGMVYMERNKRRGK